MTRKRGFEVISKYEGKGLSIPKRSTANSAGYDFEASEDIVIPSLAKSFYVHNLNYGLLTDVEKADLIKRVKPVLVPTGIKAYMGENEFLQLANRSSNPLKNFLLLANGVGVIDSDYYENEDNEGHIYFQFINFGLEDIHIKAGDKIGQGVFLPFLVADEDNAGGTRIGGFGSTSK